MLRLLISRFSVNCSPKIESLSMPWQVSKLHISCSPCNEDSGNSDSLHNQSVLSCVYAAQIPFTVNENGKLPIERGRHQVLAVYLGDHVLQVWECCYELSRCHEQLDASLPCMWWWMILARFDVLSLSWIYNHRTTPNMLPTFHYLAHSLPAPSHYLDALSSQRIHISFEWEWCKCFGQLCGRFNSREEWLSYDL